MTSRRALIVRHLGEQPYLATWKAMQAFTANRGAETADELWLLEHPPVFTQGLNGRPEHVFAPGDIPIVQSDRGGQVTYHGPGQRVAYTLIDLQRLGRGIKDLVTSLEAAVIATLSHFGIAGARRPGAPGVYVGRDKIAALGLRVKRGCSYHGLSLNVNMDLEPFARIRPCGLADTGITQISAFKKDVSMDEVDAVLVAQVSLALGYTEHTDAPPTPSKIASIYEH